MNTLRTVALALLSSLTACAGGTSTNPGGGGSTSSSGGAGGTGGMGCVASDELCDGVDNDCDEEIDEGCACIEGDTQPCHTGDPAIAGIGICAMGEQACSIDGAWGDCMGDVQPDPDESCNGLDDDCDEEVDEGFGSISCGEGVCLNIVEACVNGQLQTCTPLPPDPNGETCNNLDDNCDGKVDEDCQCTPGSSQSCYTGSLATQNVGLCMDGMQTCTAQGQWDTCIGDVLPTMELCDGLDNDCDGSADEGDPQGGSACATGVPGVCSMGVEACQGGQLACVQTVQPSAEICDGADNDCDGAVDNGNPGGGGACTTGQAGECNAGTLNCVNGGLTCVAINTPAPEQCDGLDNDCDAIIDDGNPGGGSACNSGQPGICSAGTEECLGGMIVCSPDTSPQTEACDGLDNDCDGMTDEGCSCIDNTTQGCYNGPAGTENIGLCQGGTSTCSLGAWGPCVGEVTPVSEACDGFDNDCNGATDDGDPGGGASCNAGGVGQCALGTEHCIGGAIVCQADNMPVPETCDGLDNDCDGSSDEGDPGGGQSCPTGQPGVCAAGLTTCSGGMSVCNPITSASPEVCDGQDNDCDGTSDEGNPGSGQPCPTGLLGECAAGTTTCNAGALDCVPNNAPMPEVCGDTLDNDCDGTADENCCPSGSADCDMDMVCETNTAFDPTNCGGCGVTCNPGEFCDNQICTPCPAGFSDCDADGANGCEVDTSSDALNCNGCGNVCGSSTGGLCCSSACVTPDVNNCGACGAPCFEGMLVINELMMNPNAVADGNGEWFELYNPNAFDIDVRGFVLSDLGSDSHTVSSSTPVVIPANGYGVLGRSDNVFINGGAPVIYGYGSVPALANGADELLVTAFSQLLDQIVWNAAFPPVGMSKELSTNHQDHLLNDVLGNWCNAVTPFGDGDLGTPGAVNDCAL